TDVQRCGRAGGGAGKLCAHPGLRLRMLASAGGVEGAALQDRDQPDVFAWTHGQGAQPRRAPVAGGCGAGGGYAVPGAHRRGPAGIAAGPRRDPGAVAHVPESVPAQPDAPEELSRDRGDLRHLGEDGREIHLAGAGQPAPESGGKAMSGGMDDMEGIMPREAAERWYARLMAPDCSSQERRRFDAWLASAPEHALAFEDTKALWASLGALEQDEVLAVHVAKALEPDADTRMAQWTAAAKPSPAP